MIGRLQFWLQGHHVPQRGVGPFPGAIRLGNVLSDVRYWARRALGGEH